jgi:hypothetical protein
MTQRNGINYVEAADIAASQRKSHRVTQPNDDYAATEAPQITTTTIRTFASGATRDADDTKHDFDGFLSPHALRAFGAYMHTHRQQSDGKLRDSDNWQKGIPREQFRKSAFRHFLAWWEAHRTGRDTTEEACALMFNVMGDLHESLKPAFTNM